MDPAAQNGLLSLGLALMANRSRPGMGGLLDAVGRAGPYGMAGMQNFQDRQYLDQVRQQQMADIARKRVLEGRDDEQYNAVKDFRASIPSPHLEAVQAAMSGGGGPTMQNAARMPPVDPASDMLHRAMRAGLVSPLDYLKLQQKDTAPIKLGAGESLLRPGPGGTYTPVATNPKPEAAPSSVEEFRFAVQNGYKGSYEQWVRAKSPQTNVRVENNLNTEKKFGEAFATKVAEADLSMREAALRAPDLADRASRIKKILDSGNAITGFGADFRLGFAKAAALAGIPGAKGVAADTETLGASLAQNTLDAIRASNLGSGNGFSNADRDFLEKAAGGKITMEAGALSRLADLAHRAAAASAKRWNDRAPQIPKSAIEGTGIDTSPINVGEPAKRVVRTGTLNGRKVHQYSDGSTAYAD